MSFTGVGQMKSQERLGIYTAVVHNNHDPSQKGRVKLRVPQIMGKAVSNWAQPVASNGIVPSNGQPVMAMFTGGDVNFPVYFLPETGPGVIDSTVVQLLGQTGTFGNLTTATSTASGHSFVSSPVPSWGFGAGEAIFWTEVMSDGQIIMSTVPFTDNELKPTGDHAEINVFDPLRFKFYSITIPTSTGKLSAVNPSSGLGGTDVGAGDLRRILNGDDELLIFTSSGYYFGWDIPTDGLYPAIGYLQKNISTGDWDYNQSISLTGDQLEATNPTAYSTIEPSQTAGNGGNYWGTRAINQMAVFPKSGNVVVGHYFGQGSFTSGCISVVSPSGNLLATYQIPTMTPVTGTLTTAAVRDVETDPTSSINDERFVIIYDWFGTGLVSQHPIQEFTYNAGTQTITPLSAPCISTDTGATPEYCVIDDNGALYVTQSGGFLGIQTFNMVVYLPHSGNRNLVTSAPASGGWPSSALPIAVQPDYSLGFPQQQGLGFLAGPLTIDDYTGTILLPGVSGRVGFAIPDSSISSLGSNLLSVSDSGFETTNMLSTDDATFATSVGTWVNFLASSSRTTTPPVAPPAGTNALKMQEALSSLIVNTGNYAVSPSTLYETQIYFLAGSVGRTCQVHMEWLASNGTTVISNSSTVSVTDNTSTWTSCIAEGVSPSNAAFVKIFVQVNSSAAGEFHYIASNSLWNMAISDWSGVLTNIARTTDQSHSGTFSMAISAPFANEVLQVNSPFIAVTPGQEYLATAWFRSAATPEECQININWFTSGGTSISIVPCTLTITDTTSGWSQVWCGGWCPENATQAKVVLHPATVALNEIHYVDDVFFGTQPFSAPPYVDMGLSVLEQTYPSMQLGRGSTALRRYYIPVQQRFTSAEVTAYNNGGYIPQTKSQFLVAVDLSKVLSR